jgi:uncharacterized protein
MLMNPSLQETLSLAIEAEDIRAIDRAIGAGAQLNPDSKRFTSALQVATRSTLGSEKSKRLVKTLIERGARVAGEDPKEGLGTSVHNAATNGYAEALELLTQIDGKLAFGQFNSLGHSPLICAVLSRRNDCVRMLLDSGASVDGQDDETNGDTALGYAIRVGNVEAVRLLMEHGARADVKGWMQLTPVDQLDESELPPDVQHEIRALLALSQTRV